MPQVKMQMYKKAEYGSWTPPKYMQFPANATKAQISYVNDYNKKLAYRIALARQQSSMRPDIINGKAFGLTQVQQPAIEQLVANKKIPANITAQSLLGNPERAMYVADVYQRHINRPGVRIFKNKEGTRQLGREPITEINTIDNPALSYFRYTRGRNTHANKLFALKGKKGVTQRQINAMTQQALASRDHRVKKFMAHYNNELKNMPVYGKPTPIPSSYKLKSIQPVTAKPVNNALYKAVSGDSVYSIWKNRFKHIPYNQFQKKWIKRNGSTKLIAGKQYNMVF